MNDDKSTVDRSTDPGSTFIYAPRTGDRLQVGERIGSYKLLEVLGEGGFGIVWLAEQIEPVRRRVALKIIKLGMDTKQVVARFEAERQALAMMDHPNVAKVFDAGATDRGRPYFVMEHIPGIPITDHCDRHRLGIDARLELFIQICEAVQHAHQKGIIHRDLKPSNVLVMLKEKRAVPVVIDFGVAKATASRLTDRTLCTELGQLIGTPVYMSPEQAEMTAQDIDTRSDIYSLGVLLYELLTGALPFDPQTLRRAAKMEIHRIIREVEPPKPSTRLSSLSVQPAVRAAANADDAKPKDDSSIDSILKRRRTDYRSLVRDLRGDLDWIIMRAMEKDRTRRYATAAELAADIRRHMTNQPVMAGPPSALYKTRKFVRRHRVAAGTGTLIASSLIAGAAVALWQAREAREAQRMAEARFGQVKQLAHYFLEDFYDEIAELPGTFVTRQLLVRKATDHLQMLSDERSNEMGVKLELAYGNRKIGQILSGTRGSNLGLPHEAEQRIQQARDIHEALLAEDPNNEENQVGLGMTCVLMADLAMQADDVERARGLYNKALAIAEQLDRARSKNPLSRKLLAIARLAVANVHPAGRTSPEAGQLIESAVAICQERTRSDREGNEDARRDLTVAQLRKADYLMRAGEHHAAVELCQQVLKDRRQLWDEFPESVRRHRDVINAQVVLACALVGDQPVAVADDMFRQALAAAQQLANADANDQRSQEDVPEIRVRYAKVRWEARMSQESFDQFGEARKEFERLALRFPQSTLKHRETVAKIDASMEMMRQAVPLLQPAQ